MGSSSILKLILTILNSESILVPPIGYKYLIPYVQGGRSLKLTTYSYRVTRSGTCRGEVPNLKTLEHIYPNSRMRKLRPTKMRPASVQSCPRMFLAQKGSMIEETFTNTRNENLQAKFICFRYRVGTIRIRQVTWAPTTLMPSGSDTN
jgi:hypothetical protein